MSGRTRELLYHLVNEGIIVGWKLMPPLVAIDGRMKAPYEARLHNLTIMPGQDGEVTGAEMMVFFLSMGHYG